MTDDGRFDAAAAWEWEDEVRAFEQADAARSTAAGAIVLVGSSSIRMWTTLASDLAPLVVVNRGFGGATMRDVLHYAQRIVTPCRPRGVVLAAGENDLEPWRGRSAGDVAGDTSWFAELMERSMPGLWLYVLNVKPSPARAETHDEGRRLNAMLDHLCRSRPRRRLVDVAGAMLDADGRVRRELFLDDGLHLSPQGYEAWTSVLRPIVMADAERAGFASASR